MRSPSKVALILILLLSAGFSAKSQISWPEGQLLPAFPQSAQTQDLIYLDGSATDAEMYLFSSLKGIVNRTQPRIFSYEGDNLAEGPYTWLNSLGVKYIEYKGDKRWDVLSKYLSEVSGLIVYDPEQIHTVSLATTLAKGKNALIASPDLLNKLTSAPYKLPVLEDLRGKFTSQLQVYQTLFDTYWPDMDKRILIGLSPVHHKASLREYAVALGMPVIWLDPKVADESALLNKFLESMPEGANYMGWWPEEEPGVTRVSGYGMTTIASDYCTNLTFHSGLRGNIQAKPMPPKPELQNKIYVAFILSDGDNLQYVEHLMRKLWNNPDRGSVPIGWTISPAMADAMPGALNYYHKSSTDNDNLISGPSGYGYTYPNKWSDDTELNQFVAKTEEYNVRAGIRVVTVWNTITGGIDRRVGQAFALHAPTLLGLTAQNTGGRLSIYTAPDQGLPGMPLSCNYCTNAQAMKEHIASAAYGWSGNRPIFVIIQAQPWNDVSPTSFKNVMNSLDDNYVVVRPDHIFQLMREANGLSVNPGGAEGNGTGLAGNYYSGKNFETKIATKVDASIDFKWASDSPVEGVEANNFSVKWTGQIQPRYNGNYTFYITNDNVSRVWIGEEMVINKETAAIGTFSDTISLVRGQKYDIMVEYVSGTRSASCKLEWASPFQSREVIPASQLYDDMEFSGIGHVNEIPDFELYPNPSVDGKLYVEITNDLNSEIELTMYDICGKIWLKRNFTGSRKQVDVSSLPKGIYLLSLSTGQHVRTVRYIVN